MISASFPGGQIHVLDWYDISAHSGLLSGFSPYCPGHLTPGPAPIFSLGNPVCEAALLSYTNTKQ